MARLFKCVHVCGDSDFPIDPLDDIRTYFSQVSLSELSQAITLINRLPDSLFRSHPSG